MMKVASDVALFQLQRWLQHDESLRRSWAARSPLQIAHRLTELSPEDAFSAPALAAFLQQQRSAVCWCLLLLGGRVDMVFLAVSELLERPSASASYSGDEGAYLQQLLAVLQRHQAVQPAGWAAAYPGLLPELDADIRLPSDQLGRSLGRLTALLEHVRAGASRESGELVALAVARWHPGTLGCLVRLLRGPAPTGSPQQAPATSTSTSTSSSDPGGAMMVRLQAARVLSHLATFEDLHRDLLLAGLVPSLVHCLVWLTALHHTAQAAQHKPPATFGAANPLAGSPHLSSWDGGSPLASPSGAHPHSPSSSPSAAYLASSLDPATALLAEDLLQAVADMVGPLPGPHRTTAPSPTALPAAAAAAAAVSDLPAAAAAAAAAAAGSSATAACPPGVPTSQYQTAGREFVRTLGGAGVQAVLSFIRSIGAASGSSLTAPPSTPAAKAAAIRALAALAAHPPLRRGLMAAGVATALTALVERAGGLWPSPAALAASAVRRQLPPGCLQLALLALVRCLRPSGGTTGGGGGSTRGTSSGTVSLNGSTLGLKPGGGAAGGGGGGAVEEEGGRELQLLVNVASLPLGPVGPAGPAGEAQGSDGLMVLVVVEATEAIADICRDGPSALRLLEGQAHLVLLQRLLAGLPPASSSAGGHAARDPLSRRHLDACLRGLARLALAAPSSPDLRLARTHEALLHALLAVGLAERPGWWALQGLCAMASDFTCASDLVREGVLPPIVAALRGLAANRNSAAAASKAAVAAAAKAASAAGAEGAGLSPFSSASALAVAAAGASGGGGSSSRSSSASSGASAAAASASASASASATSRRNTEVAHLLGLLLQNLAAHKSLATVAVEEGAVRATCEWLGVCVANEDVEGAVLCCATLCLLGDGDQNALVDMVHTDGIDCLVELLHPRWATVSLVPSTVAAAIAVACRWPASAQAVRMATGIPAMADLLRGPHGLACCRAVINAMVGLITNDPPSLREIRTTNTVIGLGMQLQLMPNNDPRASSIRMLLRQLGEDPDTAMRLANCEADAALASAAASVSSCSTQPGGPHNHGHAAHHHHQPHHQGNSLGRYAQHLLHQPHPHTHPHHHSHQTSHPHPHPHPHAESEQQQRQLSVSLAGGVEQSPAAPPRAHSHPYGYHAHSPGSIPPFSRRSDQSAASRPLPDDSRLGGPRGACAASLRGAVSRSSSRGTLGHDEDEAAGFGGEGFDGCFALGDGDGEEEGLEGRRASHSGDLAAYLATARQESSYKSLRRASLKQLAKRMDASDFSDVEDDVEDYMALLEAPSRDPANGALSRDPSFRPSRAVSINRRYTQSTQPMQHSDGDSPPASASKPALSASRGSVSGSTPSPSPSAVAAPLPPPSAAAAAAAVAAAKPVAAPTTPAITSAAATGATQPRHHPNPPPPQPSLALRGFADDTLPWSAAGKAAAAGGGSGNFASAATAATAAATGPAVPPAPPSSQAAQLPALGLGEGQDDSFWAGPPGRPESRDAFLTTTHSSFDVEEVTYYARAPDATHPPSNGGVSSLNPSHSHSHSGGRPQDSVAADITFYEHSNSTKYTNTNTNTGADSSDRTGVGGGGGDGGGGAGGSGVAVTTNTRALVYEPPLCSVGGGTGEALYGWPEQDEWVASEALSASGVSNSYHTHSQPEALRRTSQTVYAQDLDSRQLSHNQDHAFHHDYYQQQKQQQQQQQEQNKRQGRNPVMHTLSAVNPLRWLGVGGRRGNAGSSTEGGGSGGEDTAGWSGGGGGASSSGGGSGSVGSGAAAWEGGFGDGAGGPRGRRQGASRGSCGGRQGSLLVEQQGDEIVFWTGDTAA